eukprot:4629440-Ditylum_brightwellii.AAC.1
MARTKQTPRLEAYERLDAAPKDDKPKEDDNVPKGSSFDDVHQSLRIIQNLSDDMKKTNKLGKKTDSKYEFDDKNAGRENSEESYVKDDE